jgi:hypothetical protein
LRSNGIWIENQDGDLINLELVQEIRWKKNYQAEFEVRALYCEITDTGDYDYQVIATLKTEDEAKRFIKELSSWLAGSGTTILRANLMVKISQDEGSGE